MQGIADAIKYLYRQFILRDVVAYVTPGAILAGSAAIVLFGPDAVVKAFQHIRAIAYVPIYGLLFITGFAIQNFGEIIHLLPDHKRESYKKRFAILRKFHEAASVCRDGDKVNAYGDELERTRERIEVKKYASGNIALAVLMSMIFIPITKFFPNSGSWAVASVGAILIISLLRGQRLELEFLTIWEDEGLRAYVADQLSELE